MLGFEIRGLRLSGSFLSIVLAMALLGPAPGRGARAGVRARRRVGLAAVARRATSSNFGDLRRPSRCVGGLAIHWLAGDFDPRNGDPLWFAAVVLFTFIAANTLNFLMVAAAAWFAYGVPVAQLMLRSFVTALPSEFATGAADRQRRLHLRPPRHGLGRPGRRDPVRLPLHPAHQRPGPGARRGADQAHARARLAADGPALDGAADALDARRDDGAPLGRGRALLAHGGGDARPRRARAGPDPHRRAAARHRQVHPPRLRPVRGPQAHRRGMGADQAPPRAGRQARRAHRGLRPGRRDRPAPPRALRRRRLSRPASPARTSRSARASSPSRTPTT